MFVTAQQGDGSLRVVDTESGASVLHADPDAKIVVRKIATIARTNSTAKNLFMLPANAIPISLRVIIPTASDAVTTAVISVGKTGTGTHFLSSYDVKGNSGQQSPTAVTNLGSSVGTSAIQVIGIYADTGGAATTGGPFTVTMEYYLA